MGRCYSAHGSNNGDSHYYPRETSQRARKQNGENVMTDKKQPLPTEVSSVGTLEFLQLKKPYVNQKYLKPGETAVPKYIASQWHQDDTADGQRYLQLINEIDSRKVSRKNAPNANAFKVKHSSQYQPIVKDSQGNILTGDEIPSFDGRYDKGTARVEFAIATNPRTGEKNTYLKAIQILDLELGERPEKTQTVSKLDMDTTEQRLNQLHNKA